MTTTTTTTEAARPGFVGRLRSRQAGHPSGLLGRLVGRLMVRDTADTNDRALAKLDLTQPRTILDVGFGQGRTAAVVVRAGHRVLGIDPSPTMVKQATARNRAACRDGRATLRHGDGTTIPFPDDSADAAITAHTIYFMPDPAATIADIARVLRPGGTLVIACRTNDDETPAWIDRTSTIFDPPTRSHECCEQPVSTTSTTSRATPEHTALTCSSLRSSPDAGTA